MTATGFGPYARPLDAISLADTDQVGRKAAVLGELSAAGFPVPQGFSLTADALAETLAGACGADVAEIPLPDKVSAGLSEIAGVLGDTPVAVRSSGVAEDLEGMSFAGQYESILNVVGAENLVAAVRACWASAFSARVSTYQGSGEDEPAGQGRMSVLIQRMVPADAAGVAFSANPVTGNRSEVLVSAVRGLGDRLVSGNATPDEWVVRDGGAERGSGAEDAITAGQAVAVAELAAKIEAHFGVPQDIEWAIADGAIWLLQARPITALPDEQAAIAVEVPPGFWSRSNYSPRPMSPLLRSVALPLWNTITAHLFVFGIGDRIEFCEVGGWLYSRFKVLQGPQAIMERLGEAMAAVARDDVAAVLRNWFTEWQPALTARQAELRDTVDPAALSDDDLLANLADVLAVWGQAWEYHYRIGGAGTLILGELGVACRELLGWDAPETFQLLTGLPGKTTEPAYRLAELVGLARERPWVVDLLATADEAAARALENVDRAFAHAFDAYQREFGHRLLGLDFTEQTMAEQPVLVLKLIAGQLDRDFDPTADAAALVAERRALEDAARLALAQGPNADRDRFERLLGRAQWAYPARDDSQYFAQVGAALVRRTVLEIGSRLAGRGQLAAGTDVFLLEHDEIVAALRDGSDRRDLVGRRRAEQTWAQANRGPASYGEAPPPPSPGQWMSQLPPAAQALIGAGMWAWREVTNERAQSGAHGHSDGTVRGIAASRGTYTGPVRVILSEAEFDKLQPGDVLVCPETTATWSVLFPSVGALVTDHGGLLSHPAIIAREYRVPAVLATEDATTRLRDGQIVTVDGAAGTVEIASI
ncbi:MAG: PEP/pyruvate-binding domain-containing protein [Labedaea sp.]